MRIEIPGEQITSLFNDFIKSGKLLFNFYCDGYRLKPQLLAEFTVETIIPITVLDNDYTPTEMSVFVTSAVKVLEQDKPVIMEFKDGSMQISQDTYQYTMLQEFEARKELPHTSEFEFKKLNADKMKFLTTTAVSMSVIAKELKIYPIDPVFQKGKCYINYDNISFSAIMDIEDSCLSLEILRQVIYRLSSKPDYYYWEEKSTFIFKSGAYTFWVPSSSYNAHGNVVSGIDKKFTELVPFTKINVNKFAERLEVIANNFPRQSIKLSIDDFKYYITVSSGNMFVSVGDIFNLPMMTMNITTGILSVICKLFREDTEVEILKGGNCICLRNRGMNLLIAGLIY